jgi:hypothetical protein
VVQSGDGECSFPSLPIPHEAEGTEAEKHHPARRRQRGRSDGLLCNLACYRAPRSPVDPGDLRIVSRRTLKTYLPAAYEKEGIVASCPNDLVNHFKL